MEDGFHATSQKSRSSVLLSRVFSHVLFPPQAAHGSCANQVRASLSRRRPESETLQMK